MGGATHEGGRPRLRLGRARRSCDSSWSRPTTSRRASARRSSSPGSPYAASTRRARSTYPTGLLTTDSAGLVARDDVDLVIETIGGIEPARTLILSALEHGKSVVTANKALLAEDGPTLFDAADKAGRDLYYEAAVAGAIPILRPLRESLAGDKVTRVHRHRQRHHQLHPRQDGQLGRRLQRGAGGGAGARVRRGRPDRRRRGLRRRRQDRDPGQPGLPHPGDRRRRAPRGHHRGHRRPTCVRRREMGCVVKLLGIAELVADAARPARVARERASACTRR